MSKLEWKSVSVTIPAQGSRAEKVLLSNVNGYVEKGEMLAIMGPSGSGKTTLLNILANRSRPARAIVEAEIRLDGQLCTAVDVQRKSRFVESNDVLIGSLTVRETLKFAADLSLPSSWSKSQRQNRVNELLQAFGLTKQADTIVGTLIQTGISTGQKRRLSVASMLTAAPQILFLDEPTSGLDSSASHNVMTYIKNATRSHNLLVVCSIHQPSSTTFAQFDKLLLLSEGQMCYFGDTAAVKDYFEGVGFTLPLYVNPADYILELVNVDFEHDSTDIRATLSKIHAAYRSHSTSSNHTNSSLDPINTRAPPPTLPPPLLLDEEKGQFVTNLTSSSPSSVQITPTAVATTSHSTLTTTIILLHRSLVKSRRDILVYGIRFGMYLGLALMMGTVWLRLAPLQTNIQPYANCILFGSAFMSFMAIVYVPAFIEDRLVYVKDHANGLYSSPSFFISNFLVGLPYLFAIALTSSLCTYWLVNFRPDAAAFFTWVMWMYLNLVAAESLVVLIASLVPNFVGALALTAMTNGIWMACNGFMVARPDLNVFYRYVFYYVNYQAYVFRGLVVNEFGGRNYQCNNNNGGGGGGGGGGCYCMIDTPLRGQCEIMGEGVLRMYGFTGGNQGKYVGIMVGIIVGLRLLGWAAMEWRR